MASGWANEDAVNQQIQDSISDEISRIRNNLPTGISLDFCEECGNAIPNVRKIALPGVHLCVSCQEELDGVSQKIPLYNRKGSKDSQLR